MELDSIFSVEPTKNIIHFVEHLPKIILMDGEILQVESLHCNYQT